MEDIIFKSKFFKVVVVFANYRYIVLFGSGTC